MIRSTRNRKYISPLAVAVIAAVFLALAVVGIILWYFWPETERAAAFTEVRTLAGLEREFGEPFGIAIRDGAIYVSDGEADKIWKIGEDGTVEEFAVGLNTPSGIAFNADNELYVADTGSHTIKKIAKDGGITTFAGTEGRAGFADGNAPDASFNAPIGIAVSPDGKQIAVADTYNDRIRIIENGSVRTLAGSTAGFAEGMGETALFDTPTGLAYYPDGTLLVADLGNRRIRTVAPNGITGTLAGGVSASNRDGTPGSSRFIAPMALAVDIAGVIYVADGNSIRAIGRRSLVTVETLTDARQGYADGAVRRAGFNRLSGLAVTQNGDLAVADSGHQAVRVLTERQFGKLATHEDIVKQRLTAEEFRNAAAGRWPYDPPSAKRDIAGTLGEIRGEIVDETSVAWFHNGLDIAGNYGETARFVRDEKVLLPEAAANFGTLRELLRMPTMGYIHIRLGRNSDNVPFDDVRFQFRRDANGDISGVRIPRGTKFTAGEAIGTLNRMNHVHLVAGRSGSEMNALMALSLPGVSDSITPLIEDVKLFDRNGNELAAANGGTFAVNEPVRVIVRAFDRMDGNPERRKLGLYRVGYRLLSEDGSRTLKEHTAFTMSSLPETSDIHFVYAPESHSGATGVTIFNYIATNKVYSMLEGTESKEGFIDLAELEPGKYVLRVFVEDYFGNVAEKDLGLMIAGR